MQINFIKNFNIYINKTMVLVMLMGIASGMPMILMGSTLSAWLNEYGISKKTIGLFAIIGMPFSFKFLWAPLVDTIKIPFLTKYFGQRRSWLLLMQIFLAISLFVIGHLNPQVAIKNVAIAAFLISCIAATQDIIIDAYRVELLVPNIQAAGSASAVFGYRLGMIISGSFVLFIVDFFRNKIVNFWGIAYMAMAIIIFILLILILILSYFCDEYIDKSVENITNKSLLHSFYDFINKKNWLLILIFVASFKLGEAFALSLFTPFLMDLGFTLTQIGIAVKIFGMIATIFGGFIGGVFAYKCNIINAILICSVLQGSTNAIYIIQNHLGNNTLMLYFTIFIENSIGGMSTAIFIAYISQLCNKQYTATQYAILTSIASFGRVFASSFGGFIVSNFGWDVFFLFSIVLSVPSILIVLILRFNDTLSKNEKKEEIGVVT